eukprot:Hpha_TRINITY_DN16764_c2_g2::TRINITY_DN16764_c2_g2_i1::g.78088::m.78088
MRSLSMAVLLLSAAAAEAGTAILAFNGRADSKYTGLMDGIKSAAAKQNTTLFVVEGGAFADMKPQVEDLKAKNPGAKVFYAGHGMQDGTGAAAAQEYAKTAGDAAGVVLLAGFLTRTHRPSVAKCAAEWSVQPTHKCPKGVGLPLCPGGYLPDGVHDCPGPAVPEPAYAVPSLTVGGELDGVVRIARIAEAWYTQQGTPQHQVAAVDGMNHAALLDSTPDAVQARDLAGEISAVEALVKVSQLVADFVASPGAYKAPSAAALFSPLKETFVDLEGSWWWTSNSDEIGGSPWSAAAQERLASPLPEGWSFGSMSNEFHLVSDETKIPPYYRLKHRANTTVSPTVQSTGNKILQSVTIAQLRYVKLTVTETAVGENGYAIIKEEKSGVLNAIKDDGADYTSAIEIATKLASRQIVYNRTNTASPKTLDDGDRCAAINQVAYETALGKAPEAT